MNLRGEYHVDNITAYDEVSVSGSDSPERMDVDADGAKPSDAADQNQTKPSDVDLTQPSDTGQAAKDTKVVKFEADREKKDERNAVLDTGKLYPIFWSLQQYFSTPTTIFVPASLKAFKSGLEATLSKFKEVQKDFEARGSLKPPEEGRHGLKRKRGSAGEEMASSFNPKYLTSRDLFELEVGSHLNWRHTPKTDEQ